MAPINTNRSDVRVCFGLSLEKNINVIYLIMIWGPKNTFSSKAPCLMTTVDF